MKKWAPFSSLIEQSTCLQAMKYQRNKVPKPKLTTDQIEKINDVLQNYEPGQVVKIKFYNDGYIYESEVEIKRIDLQNRCLILNKGKLKFENLLDIDNYKVF